MNIGEIQRKLSLKAERNPDHQFGDLSNLLYDQEWLKVAHDHVKQNSGNVTAGCDGINMRTFDENLEDNLQKLAQNLKNGTLEPLPVRRVYIPKKSNKLRPLGIPSIQDRIVQEALRMILEPIYEADFSQYSFGFRPNRCTMDAIKCLLWSTYEHKRFFWVIEGDISSYFDTVNHRKLIKLLRRRIKDEKILDLIWKMLKAGVMERKVFKHTHLGVPQGGIVSPLLANVYLHELDQYMKKYTGLSSNEKAKRRRKQNQANFVYIRYADDWIVLSNGTKAQVEELKQELTKFLSTELKLKLSMEKTKITHLNDGFKFLGYHIRRCVGKDGVMTTKVLIPGEAVDKIIDKITTATNPSTHNDSVNAKIQALNRIIGGWCRYYQYASSVSQVFRKVDHHTFWSMAHWLGRKFKFKMPDVMRRFAFDGISNGTYRLTKATAFKALCYKKRFLKLNPYTTSDRIQREEIFQDTHDWTGWEGKRPGMVDLRPLILERDGYLCQQCGIPVTHDTAQIDHKRPVRRFKLAVNANQPDNLWTLCKPCHLKKTKSDKQRESRMP